jgi:glycosyltransferase involved in cell wall biosynthesis
MRDFRISVAMCTYNGARFLLEQLESFATQTRLLDEVVICDDRSTDATLDMARAFALRAPFPVRIEQNEHNLGSILNFEQAVSLCDGTIIALADQDDIWKPQKLAVMQKSFSDHPEAGYVFSDAQLLDAHGGLIGRKLWESVGFTGSLSRQFTGTSQVAALLQRSLVTGATMAFRSDLRTVILPFSPYLVHDYWISLLASCVGSYGVPIPECLIQYRQHSEQQIGARKKSTRERVRLAREREEAEYQHRIQGLHNIRDRLCLASAEGKIYPTNHLALVEEKLEHCSRRLSARSERGVARAGKVFAEALTGRYGRFSDSWRSMVVDICF